jgi:hypothetical protein
LPNDVQRNHRMIFVNVAWHTTAQFPPGKTELVGQTSFMSSACNCDAGEYAYYAPFHWISQGEFATPTTLPTLFQSTEKHGLWFAVSRRIFQYNR